jgi:hypothetical protein
LVDKGLVAGKKLERRRLQEFCVDAVYEVA